MGYLGNTPGESFISFAKQVFTIVNSQTAYTLNFAVVDENELRLVINNVVQEPGSGKAYTASGTTLTLSAALTNGTDEMYCVFLGKARETVTVPTITKDKLNLISTSSSAGLEVKGDGTTDGTLQLNCSQNSHGIKLASPPHSAGQSYTLTFPQSISADTFLKTDGSGNLSFASAGGTNTPAFQASLTNSLAISDATTVDIVFNSELYDVGTCYDNSTGVFTVPSGEAGKYVFGTNVLFLDSAGNVSDMLLYLHTTISSTVTQSLIARAESTSNGTTFTQFNLGMTFTLNLSVGDAVKVQAYADTNNGSSVSVATGGTPGKSIFYGYKLIE